MDFVSLAFYAVVCGALSLATPARARPWARLALGAAVGVCAALTLPFLQESLNLARY